MNGLWKLRLSTIPNVHQLHNLILDTHRAFYSTSSTHVSTIARRQIHPSRAHFPRISQWSRTRLPRRRAYTTPPPSQPTSPNVTPHLNSPPKPAESLSLSQRLKKLSREYGWSALGVYFALSALDFPFCFVAVRLLGTERIGHWEHVVVSSVKQVLGMPIAVVGNAMGTTAGTEEQVDTAVGEPVKPSGWGVEAAQEANSKSNATLWTQLALAYAIHKSFIFLRVPLTAAVTPRVVKVLRGWGWNIGKRTPKAVSSTKS